MRWISSLRRVGYDHTDPFDCWRRGDSRHRQRKKISITPVESPNRLKQPAPLRSTPERSASYNTTHALILTSPHRPLRKSSFSGPKNQSYSPDASYHTVIYTVSIQTLLIERRGGYLVRLCAKTSKIELIRMRSKTRHCNSAASSLPHYRAHCSTLSGKREALKMIFEQDKEISRRRFLVALFQFRTERSGKSAKHFTERTNPIQNVSRPDLERTEFSLPPIFGYTLSIQHSKTRRAFVSRP